MYMFRAISCSSSGGQIVLIQHLVSSLSVSDRPVYRLRKNCRAVETLELKFYLHDSGRCQRQFDQCQML